MNLKNYIRDFPDFPKPGILFRDISPILSSPKAVSYIVDEFYNYFKDKGVDLITGAETRGLIFASAMTTKFNKGLFMVRKKGKLPGATRHISYELEYNTAILEVQHDAIQPGQRVLIIDDLLATGGTSSATAKLIEHLGGVVVGFAFVIELAALKGREMINNYDIKTLVTYDD